MNRTKEQGYITGVLVADLLQLDQLPPDTNLYQVWLERKSQVTSLTPGEINRATSAINRLARFGRTTLMELQDHKWEPWAVGDGADTFVRGMFPVTDEDRTTVERVRQALSETNP